MIRSVGLFTVFALVVAGGACSRRGSAQQVVIEIPSGFNGNFLLEMGVKNAPELAGDEKGYEVLVPRSGKLTTSTLLSNPQVTFRNRSDGSVWGYSHSVYSTGDGIQVGGKIEFFVGTKQDYDAQQNRRNHSGGFVESENLTAVL